MNALFGEIIELIFMYYSLTISADGLEPWSPGTTENYNNLSILSFKRQLLSSHVPTH